MATINEEIARKMLGDVPEDKQFYCSDGRVLKNLNELSTALAEMSDETFNYHSNETKTDFSNWVKDVIGDEKLALDLQKSGNRIKASKAASERIAWLRAKTIPVSRRPR
jgi:hypothetical protein